MNFVTLLEIILIVIILILVIPRVSYMVNPVAAKVSKTPANPVETKLAGREYSDCKFNDCPKGGWVPKNDKCIFPAATQKKMPGMPCPSGFKTSGSSCIRDEKIIERGLNCTKTAAAAPTVKIVAGPPPPTAPAPPQSTGGFFCYPGWDLVDRTCWQSCPEGEQTLGAPVLECGKCPPGSQNFNSVSFSCTGPGGGIKDPIYYKRKQMQAMYKTN